MKNDFTKEIKILDELHRKIEREKAEEMEKQRKKK